MRQCVFYCGTDLNQFFEVVSGGIRGTEGFLPLMASLAEIINTFLAAQIRARAVNGGDAAALQLVQRKADGMEIGGNQPAETLTHQKIKASDGCQGGRAEVHFS